MLPTMSDDNAETNEQAKKSPVSNPVSGAITYGLGCAASVALGAAVRGHSVHDEAMTVVIGGVICGAVAGLMGSILLISLPQTFIVADYILQLIALLLLPFVGHELRAWTEFRYVYVLVDILIGSCIIAGGLCVFIMITIIITTYCLRRPIPSGFAEPLMDSEVKGGQMSDNSNANRV